MVDLEALWVCHECLYTAWESAVEDPGHITTHRDPDYIIANIFCNGRMRRYEVTRAPQYPDPEFNRIDYARRLARRESLNSSCKPDGQSTLW